MTLNILATETTDWVMALTAIGQLIVTAVGFILLYVTFALQAKVSMDQQKMLEIEGRRVRREIRPSFSTKFPMKKSSGGANELTIHCNSNNAFKLKVTSFCGIKIIRDYAVGYVAFVNANEPINLPYKFIDNIDPTDEQRRQSDYNVKFALEYEDADGFPYKQILNGTDGDVNAERPIPLW